MELLETDIAVHTQIYFAFWALILSFLCTTTIFTLLGIWHIHQHGPVIDLVFFNVIWHISSFQWLKLRLISKLIGIWMLSGTFDIRKANFPKKLQQSVRTTDLLVKSQLFTAAKLNKWNPIRWYHFLDQHSVQYKDKSMSALSTPPMNLLYTATEWGFSISIFFLQVLSQLLQAPSGSLPI